MKRLDIAAIKDLLIEEEIKDGLQVSYDKYTAARQRSKIGSREQSIMDFIADITKVMMPKAWQALENGDTKGWHDILQDAQATLQQFLHDQGESEIPRNDCRTMLLAFYHDDRGAVDTILSGARIQLTARRIKLSHKIEEDLLQGRYTTFDKFFGDTFERLRKLTV